MFEIIQESAQPKLTQTSIYTKFDKQNNLSKNVVDTIKSGGSKVVSPDDIQEILSLMKLNGDAIVKKAIEAFKNKKIIMIYDKETSKIPITLPYIIINRNGTHVAYIFADTVVTNLKSSQEYTNLMAVMEAAYLALILAEKPNKIVMNGSLMLMLCNIYQCMVTTPLEQKLYMKGDNLSKAIVYCVAYFYKTFRDENISEKDVPYNRFLRDKMDPIVAKEIITEVREMNSTSFLDLLKLIMKINPVRYKNLDQMYVTYFIQNCGAPILFAIENLQYLFLLITSSAYKTQLTQYSLNKFVGLAARKLITNLTSIGG